MKEKFSKHFTQWFSFIIIFLFSYSHVLSQTVNESDSILLVNFHQSVQNDGWGSFWDTSKRVSQWKGVTLDPIDGTVTGLSFVGTDLGFYADSISGTSVNYLVDLQNLSSLSIVYFGLKSLPKEIGKLSDLTFLNIANNNLSTLSEEINMLNKLEYLYLSSNKFSEDLDISGLQAVRQLTCYFSGFTKLPASFYQLQNLEILRISYNQDLVEISSDIQYLTKLKELYVYGAGLSSMPEEIGLLTDLEVLDLSFNNLESIPNSIGNISTLRSIKLNDNKLTVLPDSLGKIRKLLTLDVSNNSISSLPSSYDRLDFLDYINFDNNNLTTFPEVITKLLSLEKISGNNNQMSGSIPDDVLTYERQIFLNNNNFSGDVTLSGYGMPSHIELQNNKFTFRNVKEVFLDYEDYEGHIIYRKLIFHPQQKIGTERTLYPLDSDTFRLFIDNYIPLSDNTYKWYNNGTLVSTSDTLVIPDFDSDLHNGFYSCVVTNPELSGLSLTSNMIRVIGKDNPPSISVNDATVRSGEIFELKVIFSDDFTPFDDLSFSFTQETDLLSIEPIDTNSFGTVTFLVRTKGTNTGTNQVVFTASDEIGNQTNKTINITVFPSGNQAPSLSLDTIYMTNVDLGNGPVPSCTPGTASCDERYVWQTSTYLSDYTTDDFTNSYECIFEFTDTNVSPNIIISLNTGGLIQAAAWGYSDTSFTKTIKVTDSEGLSSTKDVVFICNGGITTPHNLPPVVSTIEKQTILAGTISIDTINLNDYVTDDYTEDFTYSKDFYSNDNVTVNLEDGKLIATPIDAMVPFLDTLEFTVYESNRYSYATFTIIFEVKENITSIDNEVLRNNSLSIYPNPSNGNMTFALSQSNFKEAEIIIYSTIGQEIDRFSVTQNETNYSLRNNMNSGIYHVALYLDGELSERMNIVVE